MRLPRDLSGEELVRILCRRYGYQRVHQEGSHVVLQTELPRHHRVAVPAHHSLRLGTLNAILRSVARAQQIDKDDILRQL